jgi:tRNA modification GTPase
MDVETIAARATPPGVGAIALVRLSGPRARAIVEGLLSEEVRAKGFEARRAHLRTLVDPDTGTPLDQVVVLWSPAPHSYTGEEVVEISTHGGEVAPRGVLEACLRMGAREAEPGEFTQRAWLNGRLDLVQAEAIHDLIEGRTEASRTVALHQMEGGLSSRIAELREGIVALEALLVHHIDFPDEDDPPVPRSTLADRGRALGEALARLRRTAPEGLLLREGALLVLAGPPNAGKSSLFNALVGQERAIVTPHPGTTRDALEVPLSIGGFPFRLVDTAGLRGEADEVERLGIEVAHRYLDQARLVLYCHPAGEAIDPEIEAFLEGLGEGRVLRLRTRADEDDGAGGGGDAGGVGGRGREVGEGRGEGLRISVHTGEGLDTLRDALEARAFGGLRSSGVEGGVVTRERQLRGIEDAEREVRAFVEALDGGVPVEMAATHLRPAESALESLLGVLDPEEVLDRVFREFCVGK